MKIKEESKVITQEQLVITYISEDGIEFTRQKECEQHEKDLIRNELEQKAMSIKHISFTPILVDNDHEYKWFYVTNQEELKAVQDYYNQNSSFGIDYNNITFPEWVGIEEAYDGDIYEAGTLTQYQNNVSEMIEHFNEQLTN